MSSETSAVNVHGAWSAKRLTLLAMMLALISVSSYIAIPLPFSDAKITAQTMIVKNLIGLLIAPQDTILVMASWLLCQAYAACRYSAAEAQDRENCLDRAAVTISDFWL